MVFYRENDERLKKKQWFLKTPKKMIFLKVHHFRKRISKKGEPFLSKNLSHPRFGNPTPLLAMTYVGSSPWIQGRKKKSADEPKKTIVKNIPNLYIHEELTPHYRTLEGNDLEILLLLKGGKL